MPWPVSQDYNEAIQDPKAAFGDLELQNGQLKLNSLGLPLPCSGNFADVYEVSCPATQTKWAVKCFTRQVRGLRERYTAISKHLQQANLPFGVDFQFLERGIRVRGDWFPVLKMRWVEGLLLNHFLRDNLDKPALLQALMQIWMRLARRLRESDIAHGDLQHGNVLLVAGSKQTALAVKLIDYDGMWVPALARVKSGEVGHPNYQHPERSREGTYDAAVDRFSVVVVATALRAVQVAGKALWERYDNGDNLLFKERDLLAPDNSPLFGELAAASDPLLRQLVLGLKQACHERLHDVPLLEEVIPEERSAPPVPVTAAVTVPPIPALPPAVGRKFASAALTMARPIAPDAGPMAQDLVLRGTGQRGKKRRALTEGRTLPAWVWWASGGILAAVVALATVAVLVLLRDSSSAAPVQVAVAATAPGTVPTVSPTSRPVPTTQRELPPVPPPATQTRSPSRGVGGGPLFRMVGRSDDLIALAREKDSVWQLYSSVQDRIVQRFGANAPAKVIAFDAAPDGTHAVTVADDHSVALWNTQTGRAELKLSSPTRSPTQVAVAADGGLIATSDGSNVIELLSTRGSPLPRPRAYTLPGNVGPLALSPDGAYLACGEVGKPLSEWVVIWMVEVASGKVLSTVGGHRGGVTAMAFSPDGRRMVSAGKESEVHSWQLWPPNPELRLLQGVGNVHRLLFSADGSRVIIDSSTECAVQPFAEDRVLAQAPKVPGVEMAWAFDLTGSRVSSIVVARDQSVRREAVRLQAATTAPQPTTAANRPFFQVLGNTDDLAACPDALPHTWQLLPRRKGLRQTGVAGTGGRNLTCLSATPDGKFVITGSTDGTVQVSEVDAIAAVDSTGAKHELVSTVLGGHKHAVAAVALAPDGKRALIADGADVVLWEVSRSPVLRQRFPIGTEVTAVAFSPDGKRIGAAAIRGEQAAPNGVLWCCSLDGPQKGQTALTVGRPAPVCSIAFSPDGSFLAGISADGSLAIRDVRGEDTALSVVPCKSRPQELRYSPSGKKLLVNAGVVALLYQIATQTVEATYQSDGRPLSAAFAGGETPVVATLEADGNVMWSTKTKEPVAVAPPAPPPVARKDNRSSLPTKAERAAAAREVRAKLKELYQEGDDNKTRAELYRIACADGEQGLATRYAAFDEYCDISARHGNDYYVLATATAFARSQGLDPLDVKTDALEAGTPIPSGTEWNYVHSMLAVLAEARSEDRYDLTQRLAKAAAPLAATRSGAKYRTLVAQSARDSADDQTMAPRLRDALARLQMLPGDAEANLAVGVLRCRQNRWGEGLRMLARGSLPELRDLAEKDRTEPADAAGHSALAAAWAKQAEVEKNKDLAAAWWRRSHFWYRQAILVGAPGEVARARAALREVEKRLPELADPWREMDLTFLPSIDPKKDCLQVPPGHAIWSRLWYKGGVDVTVVARAEKPNIRVSAGRGGLVIFQEAAAGGLRLHRPDDLSHDGYLHHYGSSLEGGPRVGLSPNEWHTLRWRLTPTGQKVWVDNKLVFEIAEAYDLSFPREVDVLATDTPFDLKSVLIRDLGPAEVPAK
jgi:WD40 repeat protein